MSEEEIGLIEQSIHMQQSNSSLGNFSLVHVRCHVNQFCALAF